MALARPLVTRRELLRIFGEDRLVAVIRTATTEEADRQYRLAHVEPVPEPPFDSVRTEMRGERRRLEALLVPQPEGQADSKVPSAMPDEDLVNALAQYLEFDAVEKQALLERDGVLDRCRSLIELLEMKVLVARHKWEGGSH